MKCSVCGDWIGGRGDQCPNDGKLWHNKVHKERYQRTHWGGPLRHWDPFILWGDENLRLAAAFRWFD